MSEEPHWATRTDAFGQPNGRYSFRPRGTMKGWCCHHCGGLFRGKTALVEHQAAVIASDISADREREHGQPARKDEGR
jgi:hypothetical protein